MIMKSSQLSSHAVTLTWENLTVKVKDSKIILNNVSGYCRPGQVLAIMGPSGAGKTTLLSILASKINKSLTIDGSVLANNKPFTDSEFYNFGVYIFQNDILHANLTVKQTLLFTSNLKFHNSFQASQRVDEMIATFELQKCQNTFVGGQFTKGISGGEKKRLAIAVEMITDPDLLILDEPNSGLDSHKVKSVVKVLKKLAVEKNKTVIFTLHQPSFLIYQELDRLLLIHKGRTVYQGKSADMYAYLQQTLKITVPLNSTLSDFFMMEISEYKETKYRHKTKLNYENYCLNLQEKDRQNFEIAKKQIYQQGYERIKSQRNFIEQFAILLKREWALFLRNKMKGIRLILTSLLMVFTAGFIFLKAIRDNRPIDGEMIWYKDLQAYLIKAQGTCYIAVLFCIMNNVNTVALNFPTDKQIYYKESSSKKYRSISYITSKIITEASLCMTGAIIVGIGEYFMVEYTLTIQQLFKFILTLVLCCLIGNSLGFFMGTLFKDARRASALTPIFLMPLMMFSGMYTRLDSVQNWIGWIQYISPFKYGLHCLLLNEFHDEKYVTILGVYDYKKDLQITLAYWQNIFVLMGLIGFFYGLAFIILKKMSSNIAP